jgi:hypothetical protein
MSTTAANQTRAAALKAAAPTTVSSSGDGRWPRLRRWKRRGVDHPTVAKAAGVSTWLVYAHGIREHIDAARGRQANGTPGSMPHQQRLPANRP